jgi:hypothetical protein
MVRIKLTLTNLYGNNIIANQGISLLCKLDQCMDNFQHGQQVRKKDEKVYIRSSKFTLVDMINGLSLAIFANNGLYITTPFLLD